MRRRDRLSPKRSLMLSDFRKRRHRRLPMLLLILARCASRSATRPIRTWKRFPSPAARCSVFAPASGRAGRCLIREIRERYRHADTPSPSSPVRAVRILSSVRCRSLVLSTRKSGQGRVGGGYREPPSPHLGRATGGDLRSRGERLAHVDRVAGRNGGGLAGCHDVSARRWIGAGDDIDYGRGLLARYGSA